MELQANLYDSIFKISGGSDSRCFPHTAGIQHYSNTTGISHDTPGKPQAAPATSWMLGPGQALVPVST
jgi:hypothetical protein